MNKSSQVKAKFKTNTTHINKNKIFSSEVRTGRPQCFDVKQLPKLNISLKAFNKPWFIIPFTHLEISITLTENRTPVRMQQTVCSVTNNDEPVSGAHFGQLCLHPFVVLFEENKAIGEFLANHFSDITSLFYQLVFYLRKS